jgi:hypothetical protein
VPRGGAFGKLGDCPICLQRRVLVLDHCHDTGVSREPLCRACNAGLGMFHDNPETLDRAKAYLIRHRIYPSALQWLRAQHRLLRG